MDLITAAAALALMAQGPSSVPSAPKACDVRVNVADQDPAGLNVRAAPNGAVLTALKARGRWVQVHVVSDAGDWARIDGALLITENDPGGHFIFHGSGFVAFSKLGIEALDSNARLLDAPHEGARLLMTAPSDEDQSPKSEILGCDGDWLKLRVNGLVGWTNAYCADQFTTCV